MKLRTSLAVITVSLAATIIGPSAATASVPRTSSPPQCFTVRIQNADGHIWWAEFCGTGSGGISPLEEGVSGHGPLNVDGANVNPSGCGTKAQPCVFQWPKSPQP